MKLIQECLTVRLMHHVPIPNTGTFDLQKIGRGVALSQMHYL